MRECVRERGLADTRDVFDEQMTARQQAGNAQSDLARLAENDLLQRIDRALQRRRRRCWCDALHGRRR
jgi:hypothetical protein